jgi:hypothetical protein
MNLTRTNNGTWGLADYSFLGNTITFHYCWGDSIIVRNLSRSRPRTRRKYFTLTHTGLKIPAVYDSYHSTMRR